MGDGAYRPPSVFIFRAISMAISNLLMTHLRQLVGMFPS
jgi:hypothetical protein